jgi:hypothetical protein
MAFAARSPTIASGARKLEPLRRLGSIHFYRMLPSPALHADVTAGNQGARYTSLGKAFWLSGSGNVDGAVDSGARAIALARLALCQGDRSLKKGLILLPHCC